MSLDQVKDMCVTNFSLSITRARIMIGLEKLIKDLRSGSIVVEIWIDGSFMTEKVDPEDVDIVLPVYHDIYDSGTEHQRQILESIHGNLKVDLHCDSYLFFEYPEGHPLHEKGQRSREYWLRQFGTSRTGVPKGMAVVKVQQNE
jgi:hypothetical protein